MSLKRVIPVLLLKEDGLYKTTKFKKPNYLGDPVNVVKIFNEKRVDELCVLDISPGLTPRPNFELIREIASEAFMPLSYGGGIDSIEDIRKLFHLGVEKVILNTVLFEKFEVLFEAANVFGGQSLAVSIDVKKNVFGKYIIMSNSGTKKQDVDLLAYLKKLESVEVGEIVINSIDRDGTMQGMDLDLLKLVVNNSLVPVVGVGGVGSLEDIRESFSKTKVDAVGVGSFFVYHGKERGILITYTNDV